MNNLLIYIVIALGAAPILCLLINNFWLEPRQRWSRKTLIWMSVLWPATAVLFGIVIFVFGIIRLAGFIAENPKSPWARKLKRGICNSLDAVMEPIVNRIVK